MNSLFYESFVPKVIIDPVDFNAGANTGLRVDMKDLEKVTFILVLNSATSRTSVTVDFDQHTVASAGTPAALSIANKYAHKLNAATVFTEVEPTVAADTYDLLSLVGDVKAVLVFEVNSSDLTDGYRWVSLNVTDAGAASIGACVALGKGRFKPSAQALAI